MAASIPSPARLGSVSFELRGLDRLLYILSESRRTAINGLAAALYAEASRIFRDTQQETPVRYGYLRASGYVTPPTITSLDSASLTIGYGGASAPYAWWVHERRINHRTGLAIRHDAPTKARFLADPVNRAGETMDKRITNRVGATLFRG